MRTPANNQGMAMNTHPVIACSPQFHTPSNHGNHEKALIVVVCSSFVLSKVCATMLERHNLIMWYTIVAPEASTGDVGDLMPDTRSSQPGRNMWLNGSVCVRRGQ